MSDPTLPSMPPRSSSLRRGPVLTVVAIVIVLAVGLIAVQREPGVVDFGAVPGPGSPSLPADGGLSVVGADLSLAPLSGTVLTDGGWDEAAAFVARSAAHGRPTVINLFASWCGPCEREMPMLNAVAAHEVGTDFLGVAHLDARRDAERFVAEQQVVFTTILDLDGMVAAAVGGRGLPVTVAFERDGTMVGRVFGELTEETLEGLLRLVR